MAVRLLACDLDGTLVGPGDVGLEDAVHVIDLCRQKGVTFTLATGRAFGAVERYLTYLDLRGPVITNGGALVASLGGDPIMQKTIEPDGARRVTASLRRLGLPFYLIAGREMFTEWEGPETDQYKTNLGYDISVVSRLDDGISPTQIAVRVPAEDAREYLAEFRRTFPDLSVILSLPHLIEFQARGVSKASALEYLATETGVARHEVLAVGDSLNDLDMLAWAGHSACVGNAHPDVASAVDLVASRPFSAGVLEIIKKAL